ncbi:MAG: Benzoyl-CoA-dihydrodiol lyase, partial [uncultured Pseudonocardia sp.]
DDRRSRRGHTRRLLRRRSRRLPALDPRRAGRGRLRPARHRRGRRDRPGLRAEDEQLRPGRRHRAVRHHPAAALLPARRAGGGADQRQGPQLLRGREHPDARAVEPPVEGELLQVHQRDPQRHRGRHRALRPDLDRGAQRHRGRRRLRDGAGLRADPAHRRQLLRGVAARGAAAGRAARHRRADPRDRQAPGAQGPRRRVRHAGGGRARQAGRRVAARRRGDPQAPVGRGGGRARRAGRGPVVATGGRPRRRPAAAAARGDRRRHHLPARARRVRPRRRPGARHRSRPRGGRARHRRARPRAGGRLLAAGHDPRARRPGPAAAGQRARAGHVDHPHEGRRPGRAGVRAGHRAVQRLGLAGQRDPPLLQARAQAPRRDLAVADRAHRAGLLLRRGPAGAGPGLRPAVHARRVPRGGRPGGRARADRAVGVELRHVPDGQRAVPAGVPVLGRRRRGREAAPGDRPAHRGRRGAGAGAGHRRPRRHRLGRRGADHAGGAGVALPRRAHRHGGQPPLRRAGDDGVADLLAAHRLAELDLRAPQRLRPRGRAAQVRNGTQGRFRPEAGV